MKRFGIITALAVALVAGASLGDAHALAPLGFTINPTSGTRGTTVNGQVNPADIAAGCVTDVAAFQQRFTDLFNGPFVGGDTHGDLPQTWFPDPDNTVYENTNQMAYVFTLATILGISFDINGATEGAFPQTFVMTFADANQKPLGTIGHFDPTTGVGSVVVPDVQPKAYPVAAVCAGPSFDLDVLRPGIEASGAFFSSLGMQFGTDGPSSPEFETWAQGFLGSSNTGFDLIIEFATTVGPTLIQNIAAFDALGLQSFTITTPSLGFTIDPTSGLAGSTVNGQVNPADVAAQCVTDLTEFEARFQALLAGPYAGGSASGDLFHRFFPDDDFVFENTDQTAYSLTGITALGIGGDFGGAAETALPQTFVMTFADPITQQPLGPVGHFDPVTGVGSVIVPNIPPGPQVVAAACVRPSLDLDFLEAGIRRNGAFLTSIGAPADLNSPEFAAFVESYLGPGADLFTFLNAIGPTLIQNIVFPEALGLQVFTVLANVDHFQCYRARTTGFHQLPVTLSDVFGNRSAVVRSPIDLCAPADKNGEDPGAASSPDFLTSYKLSGTGSFVPIAGVAAANQFGDVSLNVKAPKVLLVPTTVSLTGPPASPDGAFLNHFTCYDVKVTNGTAAPTPGSVSVQTAFETVQVQPQKPNRLCVPTHKNGSPIIPSAPENLLCYKAKSGKGLNPAPTAFLNNQFGQQTQRLGQRRDLCIPTTLTP
jgi:hypothetical protein